MAGEVSGMNFPWLSIDDNHHELSHWATAQGAGDIAQPSDQQIAEARAKMVKINAWYASQVGYLITKLKSIPEGGGSVFDNTVIVWSSTMAHGAHSTENMPFLVAGSAGGYVNTGRHLRFPSGTPHNHLLASLCDAVGAPNNCLGQPQVCGLLPDFKV